MPRCCRIARLAVDVGDRRSAGGRVGEGRVVAHQAEVVVRDLDLPQVHRPDGPVADLDLVALAGAVVGDAEGVAAGAILRSVNLRLCLLFRRHRTSSLGVPLCPHIFSRWSFRQTARARTRRWVCSPACHAATTSPAPCSASARTRAGAGRWLARCEPGAISASWTSPPEPAWSPARSSAATTARVVGLDQSPEMLAGARAKLDADPRLASRIELVRGEAESLPFAMANSTTSPSPTCSDTSRTPGPRCASWRGWSSRVDASPRSSSCSLPTPSRAILWWIYTRAAMPVLGRVISRDWYVVGRFLGPSITDLYRRLPLDRQLELWRAAGHRATCRQRVMSLGGGVVIWGTRG